MYFKVLTFPSLQRNSLSTSVSKMMQRAAMHFAASLMGATGGPGSQHSLSALHLKTVHYQGAPATTSAKIASAERSCKYTLYSRLHNSKERSLNI